jgi:Haem-degrading
VNRRGVVCAVAFSGPNLSSQWLLSRQIAAAKAFTANGLSNSPAQAFTTAQLFPFVQDGQPLNGLSAGNPIDPAKAYKGPQGNWGAANDLMVGEIVGGTITFGGGTVIIRNNAIVGAVGVSGDSAANDQIVSDAVAGAL